MVHTYRVKPKNDLQGISTKDLVTMHPTPAETNAERIERQEALLPHAKVIAAQEQFEKMLKQRARRNKR